MYPYRNATYNTNNKNYPGYVYSSDGERFFWAPFVVGGLAGTALGYGIANNNQINNMNNPNKPCCGFYPVYPVPYYPNGFNNFNNNFYY